ncbi:MAG: hypothetical protein H6581_23210 [Bacteroidia bacterium]|nr:hypothetical protein [Bacteroidia bacterium]
MNFFASKRLFLPLIAVVLLVSSLSGCKDACEGILCNPCESSKVLLKYVDSNGDCPSDFDQRAVVSAFNNGDFNDLAFTFDFADACTAGLLVEAGFAYVIEDQVLGVSDTVIVEDVEYQAPIEVTECCLCYPAEHAHLMINGQEMMAHFSTGSFISNPLERQLP